MRRSMHSETGSKRASRSGPRTLALARTEQIIMRQLTFREAMEMLSRSRFGFVSVLLLAREALLIVGRHRKRGYSVHD